MEAIILLLFFTILLFCTYFGTYRNYKVYHFMTDLDHTLHNELLRIIYTYKSDEELYKDKENYDFFSSGVKKLLNNISYSTLLFSFKPLKWKYWFTEEEIRFIEKLMKHRTDE